MTGGLSNRSFAASGSGGSGGFAAKVQTRLRVRQSVLLKPYDREQLVERLEKQLEIQNAITDIGKEQAKLELEVLESIRNTTTCFRMKLTS